MLKNNIFLKASPIYKEYGILEYLAINSNVTQRDISNYSGSSLSMINQYLYEYTNKGYIEKVFINQRQYEYSLTNKGFSRLKELNIKYAKSIRNLYINSKNMIIQYLNRINKEGFKNILLYGSGQVAEFFLQVIEEMDNSPLKILAIIDDDIKKQGKLLFNIEIISREKIKNFDFDGIFISSDIHNITIHKKILDLGIDKSKIINYFK